MGFCRTNLFKRLESGGYVFLQSLERHIIRNYIFLHAIETQQPLPIGTQAAELLDARVYDADADDVGIVGDIFEDDVNEHRATNTTLLLQLWTEEDFKRRAADVYEEYATRYKHRFRWLRSTLFVKTLEQDLRIDTRALLTTLQAFGAWNPAKDAKLKALYELLTSQHPHEKVLIFTQFADTVRYLETQLIVRGMTQLAGVTGDTPDPTALAWRFSPISNNKRDVSPPAEELRILIATDVLSEGQNLQDGCIVVNYDLPWAIIRLVQRAGRVDRIGQQAEHILCYSFLPADGVERIIRLRGRVRQRLRENAEVVGTDEAFFEDDQNDQAVLDLYNEKAGILDADADTEVDLASYAYQIWKNAITADPSLQKVIPALPLVAYSTKAHQPCDREPEGVLVYMRNAEGNDILAWIDKEGNSITESQFAILKAAACLPDTLALPRHEEHHSLVQRAVALLLAEERSVGGQLGRPSGARFRTYERLKHYAEGIKDTLFDVPALHKAIEDIYRHPLRQSAIDTLNRQLRSGITDEMLAQLVINLHDDDSLCLMHDEDAFQEPRIICSMGLSATQERA
jgi:hypothetical protein